MFVKHKQFKDICLEVITVTGCDNFEGYWWNMGFVKSWRLPRGIDRIFISNVTDWETCFNPTGPCLRYERWV